MHSGGNASSLPLVGGAPEPTINQLSKPGRRASRFPKLDVPVSEINNSVNSDLEKLKNSKMKNSKSVEDNLVSLISKIGEKITIGRAKTFDQNGTIKFNYLHSVVKDNLSKLAVIVSLETKNNSDNQNLIREAGGIENLIALINKSGVDELLGVPVYGALLELTYNNRVNQTQLRSFLPRAPYGTILSLSRFVNNSRYVSGIGIGICSLIRLIIEKPTEDQSPDQSPSLNSKLLMSGYRIYVLGCLANLALSSCRKLTLRVSPWATLIVKSVLDSDRRDLERFRGFNQQFVFFVER